MMRFAAVSLALMMVLSGSVRAGDDFDISAIQAKLAAQEAMLADIEAKMGDSENRDGTPENLTSMRKNAKIAIGGLVTTGYYANRATVDARAAVDAPMQRVADLKASTLEVSDAELHFEIEVNEHFDAGIVLDLHSIGPDATATQGVADEYWIRWKNISNSGFGLMVGRAPAAFGADIAEGFMDSWACGGSGDGIGYWIDGVHEDHHYALFPYNGWKFDGTTQLTPYWEGLDGKLKVEMSLMQSVQNDTGPLRNGMTASYMDRNGYTRKTRSVDYGLGTMAGRVTVTPIEDLEFTASVINFHANRSYSEWHRDDTGALIDDFGFNKNNTAASFAFSWRPCFLKPARVWAQWIHGWNVDHIDNAKSDVVNYGLAWDFTDNFTMFAQGDYMRATYEDRTGTNYKGKAWAAYVGAMYTLDSGVLIEAGYRHDRYKQYENGTTIAKVKSDMIYANVGFEF